MVLTCVITDDDPFSRAVLERHIANTPDLKLVNSFSEGLSLLEFLRTRPKVDILFLDVRMPHLTGIEIIRLLAEEAPAVILTTSCTEYALEAFELRVLDYLVKPIEYPRFSRAVERARGLRLPTPSAAPSPEVREESLFLKSSGRLLRVAYSEILYFEAVNYQTVVVTANRQFSASLLLREVEKRVPPSQFVRIHRTYMVNRLQIEAVEDNVVVMTGGRRIPIGRTYHADFLASLV